MAFLIVSIICYGISALCLLIQEQRQPDQQHPFDGGLLWLVLVILGGSIIDLSTHVRQVTFWDAAQAALVAVIFWRARGKVSPLLGA